MQIRLESNSVLVGFRGVTARAIWASFGPALQVKRSRERTAHKPTRVRARKDDQTTTADDRYWQLSAVRTDEPDVRNWQMNGRAEEARSGQFVTP
jgi:hypothetical protein